ncbi:MAG: hypothetical protein ISN29_10835 [Gammaproteobacteria bacterium AqS3]|nr:hypothetical protein [Gammaproteobacteria bacterium AqS3]
MTRSILRTLLSGGLAGAVLLAPAWVGAADISLSGGGIKITEGELEFKIGGRLMMDWDYYDGMYHWAGNDGKYGSDNEPASDDPGAEYNIDNGAATSDFEYRRLRLTFEGRSSDALSYKMTYDFDVADGGGGETGITDLLVQYKGLEFGTLTIGKFKRPAGLEELTSSKRISTIERSSLMNSGAFSVGRPDGFGVRLDSATDNFVWAFGLFNETGNKDENGANQYEIGGRAVYFIETDDALYHFGLSLLGGDTGFGGTKRVQDRFGVHTANKQNLTSGSKAVDGFSQNGIELAYRRGPFSVQFELMNSSWDAGADTFAALPDSAGDYAFEAGTTAPTTGADTRRKYSDWSASSAGGIDATGNYILVTYTLTGEPRTYKRGVFDRVAPSGEGGAWELVFRRETLEVERTVKRRRHSIANDKTGAVAAADVETAIEDRIVTREGAATTLGVNWHVNKNVRAMYNFIQGEVTFNDLPNILDDSGNAHTFRVQFDF